MLMCNEVVTLVRHIKLEDTDQYDCVAINGASWYSKTAISSTSTGVTSANVLTSRLPNRLLPDGKRPQKGDYLVRGTVTGVSSPADLKDMEYFRITAIGDNRRGRNPHWLVSGA